LRDNPFILLSDKNSKTLQSRQCKNADEEVQQRHVTISVSRNHSEIAKRTHSVIPDSFYTGQRICLMTI